ncbi:MAG: DUF2254 domain-containing protein [Alphaproteobacteria bacterium]|nr:DUF2254 domain-containing protein [Alphaproteobacteria bacterium]
MESKWQFLLWRITHQTWFRSALYSLLGVVTALVALALRPYVPEAYADKIGANSVDSILRILASSMLAVATFSLTTMVSAYNAASNSATPRAAMLLIEDTTSHNALAAFIGTFLYSVVGIILLSTGVYGGSGRLVLLAVTIAVILLVVATLLGWINRLSRLGRVGQTIDQVEAVTDRALQADAQALFLGGHPLGAIPGDARAVCRDRVAYVQHVDMGRLQEIAADRGLLIFDPARPGIFVDPARPLFHVSGDFSGDDVEALAGAFTVGGARTFQQDPRFGVIALSEIASRAMSPGINDPGTAIDVIGTLVRLLIHYAEACAGAEHLVEYDRVFVAPLSMDDLVVDGFRPVSRDGAAHVEVCIRLQKGLSALSRVPRSDLAEAAASMAREALERCARALTLDADLEVVKKVHESLAWEHPVPA